MNLKLEILGHQSVSIAQRQDSELLSEFLLEEETIPLKDLLLCNTVLGKKVWVYLNLYSSRNYYY